MTEDKLSVYENFIHDKYGYCYYFIEPKKKPIIFGLYTEPEYRHGGFARKHLEYVINEIRKTGYEGKIEIEVDPKENSISPEELALFYIRMGLKIRQTSGRGTQGEGEWV